MSPRHIAIGDLHGCSAPLDRLLQALAVADDDVLVFLGDYIDRGPDSPGVLDRLISLADKYPHTVFLRGNHDAMLLNFLGVEPEGYGDSYLRPENGGARTLEQYGCDPKDIKVCRSLIECGIAADAQHRFLANIPRAHVEFLRRTMLFYKTPDYLFVHAGFDTRKPWNTQTQDDFLWIRGEFVEYPHRLRQLVVYGHSVTAEIAFTPRIDWKARKVGIDTGAVYGGALTALILPEKDFVSVHVRDPRQ